MQESLTHRIALLLCVAVGGCNILPTDPTHESPTNLDGPSFSAAAPAPGYVQVSTGVDLSCAISTLGSVVCWGANTYGQTVVPLGNDFVYVSAGYFHACALKTDQSIVCWGTPPAGSDFGQEIPPSGNDFVQLSVAALSNCAVRTDNSVACWGNNGSGQSSPPTDTFAQVSVALTGAHSCGLRTDGSLACWGYSLYGGAPPPAGNDFVKVSAGAMASCAIKTDQTVVCWGTPVPPHVYGQEVPPAGTFDDLDVGGYQHACAVSTDGSLACWGNSAIPGPPAGTTFVQVSTGGNDACAVTSDDTVECWGLDSSGETVPPDPPEGPNVSAFKTDALLTDVNNNGLVNPGDVIRYTVVIANAGGDAAGVSLADTPDGNTSLVVGSVTTTQGSITSGNTAGDTDINVDVGTIAGDGSVTITFDVTVNNPLPAGVTTVANQGTVTVPDVGECVTDDPDTPALDDATATPVADNPPPTSTPMAVKAQVRDDLAALLPTGNRKTDRSIQKAIRELDKALTASWWTTEETLDAKYGKRVFDAGGKAVKELTRVVNDAGPSAGAAQAAIDTLVECYRVLAQTAIDAALADGDAGELAKAAQDMADGDDRYASGQYDNSIHSYRKAWEHALKAPASGDDRGKDDDGPRKRRRGRR